MLTFSCPKFHLTLNENRFLYIDKPSTVSTERDADRIQLLSFASKSIREAIDGVISSMPTIAVAVEKGEASFNLASVQTVAAREMLKFLERSILELRNHIVDSESGMRALLINIQDHATSIAQTELMKVAMHKDALTGLPNRAAYDEALLHSVERNSRYGEHFSYVIFDLDHFKNVNDTHGHLAGDEVLREMARRIIEDAGLRKLDFVARIGGEEFALILPNTSEKGACIATQKVSDVIKGNPFKINSSKNGETEIHVSASIGISTFTSKEEDPDGKGVAGRADDFLYILKGKKPDLDGLTDDRRGEIACEGRVISKGEIAQYRRDIQQYGIRESMPNV